MHAPVSRTGNRRRFKELIIVVAITIQDSPVSINQGPVNTRTLSSLLSSKSGDPVVCRSESAGGKRVEREKGSKSEKPN